MSTQFRSRSALVIACLVAAPYLVSIGTPSLAQSSAPPSRPGRDVDPDYYNRAPSTLHGKTVLIPIGTTWEGRIDSTISSARSRAGTAFNINVSSPVLLNGTDVIVPAGSKIVGEVVEAVPASSVPRRPGQDKKLVRGKLRIQISGLRTPDGVTHPLVASVAGEVPKRHTRGKTPQGTGIAYVGETANFEATDINRSKGGPKGRGDKRPEYVKRGELLKDSFLGAGDEGFDNEEATVRSLVLKGRDYYIYEGSPIMVRLMAPFKIGISMPYGGEPIGAEPQYEDTLPPPTKATANRGGGDYSTGNGGGLNAPPAPRDDQYAPQPNSRVAPPSNF